MILEEIFNGKFYPCETVVADSPRFKQAVKASAALMDTLSERLSKEDYALVEELREQVAIAQCEENESHFKYGFSAGLLVQQEAHTQVSQKAKNSIFNSGCSQTGNNHYNRIQLHESHLPINRRMAFCRSRIWKFYFRLRLALRLGGMGLAFLSYCWGF
ncbi:hypothetical protein LEA_05885 [human gut metagenome]|uniref:Uncharacterized protein n=1 Tax=human gut metagenome TaxID=408170 RepID=K1TW88_9ZZZZ